MPPTLKFWHRRYLQQANWTSSLRPHLLKKTGYSSRSKSLEVGCGTGAVLAEFPAALTTGIDIDPEPIWAARQRDLAHPLAAADGALLPLVAGCIDVCFCHFLLLWVADPLRVLREMARVTRPGGWIIAFAEPDYGGRVDFPSSLIPLGQAQIRSLEQQGADPMVGRRLLGMFSAAGLKNVEGGVLGGEWKASDAEADSSLEWQVLRSDVAGVLSPDELEEFEHLDRLAREEGARTLFVPTFYALGQVTSPNHSN